MYVKLTSKICLSDVSKHDAFQMKCSCRRIWVKWSTTQRLK